MSVFMATQLRENSEQHTKLKPVRTINVAPEKSIQTKYKVIYEVLRPCNPNPRETSLKTFKTFC